MSTSMSPLGSTALQRLWLAGALALPICAILIAAYFLLMREDYVVLYDRMRPADASLVVAELESQRVPFRLEDGGESILVPASRLNTVRLDVAGADIPLGGLEGFELFDRSELGLTEFAMKIKYQRAVQGELTRTILMMEGIEDARVHLSIPEQSLFRDSAIRPKAAVTLVSSGLHAETQRQVLGVQRLVAAAIPELAVDEVVVINQLGQVISPLPTETLVAQAGPSSEHAEDPIIGDLRQRLEQAAPGVQFMITAERAIPSEEVVDNADSPTGRSIASLVISPETTIDSETRARIEAAIRDSELLTQADLASLEFGEPYGQATFPDPTQASAAIEPAASSLLNHSIAGDAQADQPGLPYSTALDQNGLIIFGAGGAIFVLAAGLLFLLVRPKRAKRRERVLALEDQTEFAQRLKAGLSGTAYEEAHHATD